MLTVVFREFLGSTRTKICKNHVSACIIRFLYFCGMRIKTLFVLVAMRRLVGLLGKLRKKVISDLFGGPLRCICLQFLQFTGFITEDTARPILNPKSCRERYYS